MMAPLLCEPSHEMPYLAMSPMWCFFVQHVQCHVHSVCLAVSYLYFLFLISSELIVPSLLILLHFVLQYSILAARS